MTCGPRVPPELRPFAVIVTRVRDGRTFRYGFTARSCADAFRSRYLAPLPDGLRNPYTVGNVTLRAEPCPDHPGQCEVIAGSHRGYVSQG